MQLSPRSISLRSLIAGIAVIGAISIALVIYSQYLTQQDLESKVEECTREVLERKKEVEELYGELL